MPVSKTGPLKGPNSFSLAISYNFRPTFATLICCKIIFIKISILVTIPGQESI